MSASLDDDHDEGSDAETTTIVMDTGSHSTKVGFAGTDAPKVLETVVGYHKVKNTMVGIDNKDAYVGEEAYSTCEILSLKYPMEQGRVKDWDSMEKMWQFCLCNELRVDPAESRVLMTEKTRDQDAREKMGEIMFEKLRVPGLLISLQSNLSLYSQGRTTGVVVDSGHETTTVTPIYEGFEIPNAVKLMDFGGKHIDQHLQKLLAHRGIHFTSSHEQMCVTQIKEKLCLISVDPNLEACNDCQVEYELPDGKKIELQGERVQAVEPLFNPHLFGSDYSDTPGIHTALNDSINQCFPPRRSSNFLPNIVLSGGNTLFEGIKERLSKEVKNIISPDKVVKVLAPPERKHSVWIGGSILGQLSSFEDHWITSAEYREYGGVIFQRK